MLFELLSDDPGLSACVLSYVITFRAWLRIREVCTRCKYFLEDSRILWAGLRVVLYDCMVPIPLWSVLQEVLQSARVIYINAYQAGFAVLLKPEQQLVWRLYMPLLVQYPFTLHLRQRMSDMENYFLSREASPPAVTFMSKVFWEGHLQWLDIGFHQFFSQRWGESQRYTAHCQFHSQHTNAPSGDTATYWFTATMTIFWSFGKAILPTSQGNVDVRILFAPASNTSSFTIGLSWLPDSVALWVNDVFAESLQLPIRPFIRELVEPRLFFALPAEVKPRVHILPLATKLTPGTIVPWCDICAEKQPCRSSAHCNCGTNYCSAHGGKCCACDYEACGFCLSYHCDCA